MAEDKLVEDKLVEDKVAEDKLKAHAGQWWDLSKDLLKTAFFALLLYPFLFTSAFITAALGGGYFIGGAVEYAAYLEWTVGVLATVVYTLIGAASGLVHAAATTLLKGFEGIEEGIHRIGDDVVSGVMERIGKTQRSVTIDEFDGLVEEQIRKVAASVKGRMSFFSPIGWFAALLTKAVLKGLRFAFAGDFKDGLAEKGKTTVEASDVEHFGRRFLVGIVTENVKFTFELAQYLTYAAAVLFAALPVAVFFYIT